MELPTIEIDSKPTWSFKVSDIFIQKSASI